MHWNAPKPSDEDNDDDNVDVNVDDDHDHDHDHEHDYWWTRSQGFGPSGKFDFVLCAFGTEAEVVLKTLTKCCLRTGQLNHVSYII